MKFRDKDGKVYENLEAVRSAFCQDFTGRHNYEYMCDDCPLCHKNNGTMFRCCWVIKDVPPEEAARLMGYEAIEDGEDTNLPTYKGIIIKGAHPDPPGERGPIGKDGPICGCPECGSVKGIVWDAIRMCVGVMIVAGMLTKSL